MKASQEWTPRRFRRYALSFLMLLCCLVSMAQAQTPAAKKTGPFRADRYSRLPDDYTQVGTTQLYYKQTADAIDIIGFYNGYYYSSTFSDNGYSVAMRVGDNDAVNVNCLDSTYNNGITFRASIEQQAELARICYTLTNYTDSDLTVSLGTHADVMIGNNDHAPISRRKDTFGQTYGLTMKDGNGAQLCVLFGSGLVGVTPIDDFWFGYYSTNRGASQMTGDYSPGNYYMVEDGSYDSGMGWCWKNRVVRAGSTVVLSYVIGVGDVNLEPNSTFEVTPDDPDGWNDLSRPHRLTLTGSYESPAGLSGVIDYAVEDSTAWTALTDTINSGDEFTASLVAMFDASKDKHIIYFRTRDLVGNTTMLQPIEYIDVSFHQLAGISDMTFTGDSLYQSGLTCDLDTGLYVVKGYINNLNRGTASFNMEGLFPHSIGRRTYTFAINPQPLDGGLSLADSVVVYSGRPFTPAWTFTSEAYDGKLKADTDYVAIWTDNTLPGIATLTVAGKGNYSDSLTATFFIDKAALSDSLFTLTLPAEDITYDGESHAATFTAINGVGEATFTYSQGTDPASVTPPVEAGDYTVYMTVGEGPLYHGRESRMVGQFSIYEFNAGEWELLQAVLPQLSAMGWTQPWDISQGMKDVASLHGLTIKKGFVTGLDLSGQGLTGSFPYSVFGFTRLRDIDVSDNHLSGDLGSTAEAFVRDNPTALDSVRSVNVSGNQFTGNLGAFAACFQALTALDASGNGFDDISPMIDPRVTKLSIGGQTIADVVPLTVDDIANGTVTASVPRILLYDHVRQAYRDDISLSYATADESWGMTMAYSGGGASVAYLSAQNDYHGASGDTLNVTVNDDPRGGSTFRVTMSFDDGDANFDGDVNVLDLQTQINFAFDDYESMPFNFTAANLWRDSVINVQDVVVITDKLLATTDTAVGSGSADSVSGSKVRRSAAMPQATLYVRDGMVWVDTEKPLAAFELTLRGGRGAKAAEALEQRGFTLRAGSHDGITRVVGYSMTGATLPAGATAICAVGDANIVDAMLADDDAREIVVRTDAGGTVDIGNIGAGDNAEPADGHVYDLQGRRVNGATQKKGVYIRDGRKVVIK